MAEYTPTEASVRAAFLLYGGGDTLPESTAEFDRFLARVRRDAWAEGARAIVPGASTEWIDRENPYKTEDQT